jgi:hypothetical protein
MDKKINLTKIERGGVLDAVMSLQGINRSDAMLFRSIEGKLKLQDVIALRQSEFDDADDYDLSDVEIEWLLNVIDKQFSASAINPRLASAILSIDGKLREIQE